jgi:hypothetical protein
MKELVLNKQGKYKGKYKAIVDNDVFLIVNQFNWYKNNKGYAVRNDSPDSKKKQIQLHQYIWELKMGSIPEGLEVEHIDRNPLNCQISNLRLATHAENMCNKSKYKNNTSGFIGVSKQVHKQEHKDKIYINEYWQCQWQDSEGKGRSKTFPFDNVGTVRAARDYDLMAVQIKGNYTGELNFSSLSEYQHALKQAILKDIESN